MTWQRPFVNSQDLAGTFSVPAHFTSGHAIGVIAVDLKYPKLPGNVVNATTFDSTGFSNAVPSPCTLVT